MRQVAFCAVYSRQFSQRRQRLREDGIRFSPPRPRPGGASSIVRGRVEVCLWRIEQDSADGCLRQICSDLASLTYVRLSSGWILPIYVSLHQRRLLFWCAGPMGAQHNDFPTIYNNKFCAAPMRQGDDGGVPSAHFSACSRRQVVYGSSCNFLSFRVFVVLS